MGHFVISASFEIPARPVFLDTTPLFEEEGPSRLQALIPNVQRPGDSLIGRAPGPDSPPTITQCMPLRSRSGRGPRSGSRDRNFTRAGVRRRWSILSRHSRCFSTLTPIQMCDCHGIEELNSSSRSARFVSTWYWCQSARDITSKISRAMKPAREHPCGRGRSSS